MFDNTVIKVIQDAWISDQEHPHRSRTRRSAPDLDSTKALIEIAFNLSLSQEEGTFQRASIALATESELFDSGHSYSKDIRKFKNNFIATPESLAKASPAFDCDSSIFLVECGSDTQLVCWGVAFAEPRSTRFNEIPVGIEGGQLFRPDNLTATIAGVGNLRISRGDFLLGRLIRGVFSRSEPTPFVSRALGKILKPFAEADPLWQTHKMALWHAYRDTVVSLLLEAAKRGSGGAIALLADDDISVSVLEHGNALCPSIELLPLLGEMERCEPLTRLAYARRASKRIGDMAQLANVDGALILSSRLRLMSYGSKFRAPPWSGPVDFGVDGWGSVPEGRFARERFGTRHNSAIDFVGSCSKSVVFVISEDGPIRAFAKDDQGRILCWPDCSQSVFTD
ncbi:putative sensor domain DACNV-containing protein [Acuticoccus yangtzensis]|uniref:putative sensor domain DACNV-containing protein n=1 Tax=Acuticoccus yangtzensis TaxID=1443441 RepID=UPI000B152EFB|nr:hypothetical protein [Acuticoccus yangtzensis]